MTKEQFHSYVRLARFWFFTFKEKGYGDAKFKQLTLKLESKHREFTAGTTPWYDWQQGFVNLTKKMNSDIREYSLTGYDSSRMRMIQSQESMDKGIAFISNKYPEVFDQTTSPQTSLFE